MRPLPKGTDLSFLEGVELLQVCVGRNELILNFHPNARVTILGGLEVTAPDGRPTSYDEPGRAAEALFPLLGATVLEARASDRGGLMLTFRSGTRLEILDDSTQYESFWISDGTRTIIV